MNKTVIMTAVVCACIAAQARIWTNMEGKTLEAEMVRVDGEQVFLKLDRNRQIHPLPLSTLSEADREYIRTEAEKQAAEEKAKALRDRRAKWHDEFEDARAEAEEFDLPILLLYTAPSWCGYCVRLEEGVLDTSEFERFADRNLVLLVADFSETSDKEDWIEDHRDLYETFKPSGYPCMFFITSDREKIGRIGGYDEKLGTSGYIDRFAKTLGK